jgi:hypothetical protein
MAQATPHLLCKHKALSSNPSPIGKKKKEAAAIETIPGKSFGQSTTLTIL